jgi:cyclopropane-fatty-acyl-phospholipid synthase
MHHEQVSSQSPGRSRPPSLGWRLLFAAAGRLSHGRLEVAFPDRQRFSFAGREPGPDATLVVRDPSFIRRVLTGGDVAFGEAYVDGAWDTPSLVDLLELLDRNRAAFAGLAGGGLLARAASWIRHALNRNSRAGSRRNIAAHYDLGNAFYELWLDRETMAYSAAHFDHPDEPLADAQRNKFREVLGLLDLQPGHHLLEIGSGWGGFAIHAAQLTRCRVTSLTLSVEQLAEARARAKAAGVDHLVEFRLQDYRDVRGTFDRVVSIEMFEAVGERYWPAFFRAVHDRLAPGGRAALQVITIGEEFFEGYRRSPDFIQQHVFPGGMLPSPERFVAAATGAGLRVEAPSFRGADYARTLAEWDRRVFAARPQVLARGYDARFLRLWHYYLAYCEAGFRTGHCDLMRVALTRP